MNGGLFIFLLGGGWHKKRSPLPQFFHTNLLVRVILGYTLNFTFLEHLEETLMAGSVAVWLALCFPIFDPIIFVSKIVKNSKK